MNRLSQLARFALAPLFMATLGAADTFAQRQGQPTVQEMLALRPTQRFVDYDTPPAHQVAGLKADLVTEGKAKIWVLRDASGRIYRRFVDSDRDGVVDQWIYFREGSEVYRDIDSNSNGRADQFRWLNEGGSRWAVDTNEDSRIDGYRMISPEEATREVVRALAMKDYSVAEATLARPSDAAYLGKVASPEKLKDLAVKAREQFSSLAQQANGLTAESQWVRMEVTVPTLIPGDAPDGSRDVILYRDVRAVVQTGSRTDLLEFGEIAVLGRAAKILAMPAAAIPQTTPLAASNVFNNVPVDAAPPEIEANTGDVETQELITQLQKLDEENAKKKPTEAVTAQYHLQRAELLAKLGARAKSTDDRVEWLKQQADSLIAAIQISAAPEPEERLSEFYEAIRDDESATNLAGYVAFRKISADYFRKLQANGADFSVVQKEWLENLELFVAEYPNSEDTPEALSQLAIGQEFTGKEDAAKENYKKLVATFPQNAATPRARGALARLDLVGQTMTLRGTELRRGAIDLEQLRGKVVLVDYWSTKCDPWKSELNKLKELYQKYRSKGFEIVGVCLDSDKNEVAKFVHSAGVAWPVIFEPGALDSPLAIQYGILALPTQFLVDTKGQVVSRTIHISLLEDELKKLLAK